MSETGHCVCDQYHSLRFDLRLPHFGLGKATRLVPARGHLDTAGGRMKQHEFLADSRE